MYNNYLDPTMNINDIGGPSVSGKWTNKITGETVMVRDSVIMDNDMAVILANGSVINMTEFSRDYIQMSEEEYDLGGNVVSPSQNSNHQGAVSGRYVGESNSTPSPAPVPMGEQPGYDDFIDPIANPQADILVEDIFYDEAPVVKSNPNIDLIKKLFENTNPDIVVDLKLKAKNFPINELNMLTNIFGVKASEISKYIFDNYFTKEMISESINKYLVDELGLKIEEEKEEAS